MKIFSVALAGIALALSPVSTRAVTSQELAGTYQGTSTATLANGAQISANLTVTFKAKGKLTTVATVNGQTTTSKGRFQFASDDVIVGSFPSSEFTAFVDVNGSALSFTLLIKTGDGSIISERTNLTLVKKL